MRQPIVPVVALLLALATGSAFANPEKPSPTKPAQAKSSPTKAAPDTAIPAKQLPHAKTRAKSDMKPLGVPLVKETVITREQYKAQQEAWKQSEEQKRADRKARREKLKAILASYSKEGVEFKAGKKANTYCLIAPAMAKTSDPAQRKAAAKALATRFKGQVEPLFKRKIEIEVYTDAKTTQRVAY